MLAQVSDGEKSFISYNDSKYISHHTLYICTTLHLQLTTGQECYEYMVQMVIFLILM